QDLVQLDRTRYNSIMANRTGGFKFFRKDGVPMIAVLGGNIDAALVAVERNQELQELILQHLGEHFAPRE
ncbi:MAG: hypothetical protein ACOCVC_04060, partial [Spirochaeta sp.]